MINPPCAIAYGYKLMSATRSSATEVVLFSQLGKNEVITNNYIPLT